MNPSLVQWALRWAVPAAALEELREIFEFKSSIRPEDSVSLAHSENYVQSAVRLEAARKGLKLWRNNVGVLPDLRGVPVRFGLANDSPVLNKAIKSGDLVGWRPLIITSEHIGSKVAQFVSRECKRPDWRFTGTDHEKAQLRWAEAINADGGDAKFVTGEGSL